MGHEWLVGCKACGKQNAASHTFFKPRPVFELHCSERGCGAVSTWEEMSEAVHELLQRLSPAQLELIGLACLTVSDSEDGRAFVFSTPLPRLGGGESENEDVPSEQEDENMSTPTEVLRNDDEARPDQDAQNTVVNGLIVPS